MMNSILLTLTLLVFYSCANSITVKNPVHKFVTAESQNKFLKGRASLYAINGSEATIDVSNDRTDNPLDMWEGNIDDQIFGLTGELGLYNRLDFVYISGGSLGTSINALKVQVIGEEKPEKQMGNFSAALIAGHGKEEKKKNDGSNVEFWPQDEDTNIDLELSNHTAGLLLSYRHKQNLIHTFGFYKTRLHFAGTLDSQRAILDGKRIDYNANTTLLSLASTYEIKSHYFIGVEAVHENTRWERSDRIYQTHVNVNLGVQW